jgi:hypothetical protein
MVENKRLTPAKQWPRRSEIRRRIVQSSSQTACVRARETEYGAAWGKLSLYFLICQKDVTHDGSHPTVDGNDETHDEIAKHTCTDGHPPIKTHRNHG